MQPSSNAKRFQNPFWIRKRQQSCWSGPRWSWCSRQLNYQSHQGHCKRKILCRRSRRSTQQWHRCRLPFRHTEGCGLLRNSHNHRLRKHDNTHRWYNHRLPTPPASTWKSFHVGIGWKTRCAHIAHLQSETSHVAKRWCVAKQVIVWILELQHSAPIVEAPLTCTCPGAAQDSRLEPIYIYICWNLEPGDLVARSSLQACFVDSYASSRRTFKLWLWREA